MEKTTDTLLFLGTGAADWTQPEKDGAFRRNACALLNGTLLIDCGPMLRVLDDAYPHVLSGVTDVLVTHDHDDHLDVPSLLQLADKKRIRVACDGFARAMIGAHPGIEFVPVVPFVPFFMGGYAVTPVTANHDAVQAGVRQACHYVIRTPDGKTVFYGLDGAWFLRPSWEEMQRHKFDVMVLDCTVGDRDDWRIFEHNTIPMLRMMVRQIRAQKMLSPGGRIVASHFARTLHAPHEETARILNDFGVIAAYDGMKLSF